MIIFTSICANYAHKARTLAQSVKRHMPDARFVVCLTEREIPAAMRNDDCFDEIVLSKDMWEGNFDRFMFKHAIVEASTAVKGHFFLYLFKHFPKEDSYVYLDPDCYVYDDFTELREALQEKPIVLCPHLLHPGNVDMELSSTAHGVYNLGFLAVTNSDEGRRLVQWWADRLFLYCYDDIANGIFTDQKWMDLAPCFFDVKILRHYGYDFAPWGLWGCKIEEKNGKFFVQGQPVKFVHYSGYGPVAEQCMDKWLQKGSEAFRKMYREYSVQHEKNNEDGISKTVWSYANYHSGEPIDNEVRRAYRKDHELMQSMDDPFAQSNRFFKKYFAGRQRGKAMHEAWLVVKMRNARRILKEDGFAALVKRFFEKVKNKL